VQPVMLRALRPGSAVRYTSIHMTAFAFRVPGWRVRWCAAGMSLLLSGCGRTPPPQPDVILVTIDTLRADRVGRALTPNIEATGARGARYFSARSTVPLTLPAHVSLMTGTLPPTNGVRLNGVHRFDGSRPTLARLFRQAGHETAAFVGAFVLDRQFGLNDGFQVYDDQIRRSPDAPLRLEAERPAAAVVDRAIAWLERQRQARGAESRPPFFLWVHLYDPHAPYTAPPDALARAGGRPYDGEVAYADAELGRLLRAVAGLGRERPTLTVVLGDHGESLGEHGERAHGMLLYEGALRIPLVIEGPGVQVGEHREPVSLVDVAPTLLKLAGLRVPGGMQGRDLFGPLAGTLETYAETTYPQVAGWSPLAALVEERWKIIAPEDGGEELYDLAADAPERDNEASRRPATVQGGLSRIAALRGSASTSTVTPGAEAQERLRALGYVGSAPAPTSAGRRSNPAARIRAWVAFEDALELLNLRRTAEAAPVLAALVAAHPESQVFASTYANTLSALGRHREALTVYRSAVRLWPHDSMLYHDLAVAAQRAGRRQEAARAEQAATTIDPRNAAAQNGLGLVLVEDNRTSEAAQAFDRAVAADGTSAEYVANRGNARRGAGDRSGAEQDYREALTLDPGWGNALNGLGVLLVEQGRAADAIPLLERAVRADGAFWEAQLNLGIACQTAGRQAEAAAAYRAVLAAPERFGRERRAAATLLSGMAARR